MEIGIEFNRIILLFHCILFQFTHDQLDAEENNEDRSMAVACFFLYSVYSFGLFAKTTWYPHQEDYLFSDCSNFSHSILQSHPLIQYAGVLSLQNLLN